MENQESRDIIIGDVIDKSGKAKYNIEKRKPKVYGIISNIMEIINEIHLSHCKVMAGQVMLLNGILYNSEACH